MNSNMLERINKIQEIATSSFFELIDEIDEFKDNPTVKQKHEILKKYQKFNYDKNILIQKIKDVWCKYE